MAREDRIAKDIKIGWIIPIVLGTPSNVLSVKIEKKIKLYTINAFDNSIKASRPE